jgi:hypothetical protein
VGAVRPQNPAESKDWELKEKAVDEHAYVIHLRNGRRIWIQADRFEMSESKDDQPQIVKFVRCEPDESVVALFIVCEIAGFYLEGKDQ